MKNKYENLQQFQNIADYINGNNLYFKNRYYAEFHLLLACQFLLEQGLSEKENLKILHGHFPYIQGLKIQELLQASEFLKKLGDQAFNKMQEEKIKPGQKVSINPQVTGRSYWGQGLVIEAVKDSLQVLENGTGNIFYCSPNQLKKLERIISN